jgi:hypothetical protein
MSALFSVPTLTNGIEALHSVISLPSGEPGIGHAGMSVPACSGGAHRCLLGCAAWILVMPPTVISAPARRAR